MLDDSIKTFIRLFHDHLLVVLCELLVPDEISKQNVWGCSFVVQAKFCVSCNLLSSKQIFKMLRHLISAEIDVCLAKTLFELLHSEICVVFEQKD